MQVRVCNSYISRDRSDLAFLLWSLPKCMSIKGERVNKKVIRVIRGGKMFSSIPLSWP